MVADHQSYNFDKSSLNSQQLLRKRIIESLPSKPKVYFVD